MLKWRRVMSKEIKKETLVYDSKNKLNEEAIGWGRRPSLFTFNSNKNKFRFKKWNHWTIVSENHIFNIAIVDLNYVSNTFAYLYDYKENTFEDINYSKIIKKNVFLSKTTDGSCYFYNNDIELKMHFLDKKYKITLNNNSINADLEIFLYDFESLNVIVPFNKREFQFTEKNARLPVNGYITSKSSHVELDVADSYACFDFGRGVWPFNTYWNWATFSGNSNEGLIGINLGAGWTDGKKTNENAFFLNDKVYKINEDVKFDYDKSNLLSKWHIKTKSGDVDLVFQPFYNVSKKRRKIIIKTHLNQVLGQFFGRIKVEDKIVDISNIKGCVEQHEARW